ncbi:hypothetical protein B0H15DRAFT_885710 [Mycena belliarum]|uniref:GEgh 16 protein n=1 Tax=Mycena belliarum TaxID=1033014 RepID=A0AAD6U4I2_9AGAR|nr:hypothetical protein B0H15DRAFT_885710 [Mycena belliae]
MMFSSIFTSAALVLALALQANAHAMPSPALGVSGLPARSDVQRPSNNSPCGNVNIASSLDKSTAVPAEADGSVMLNITNYNGGADGSRSVSVMVDATGTGKKFVAATVTQNGDPAPKNTGTQQIKLDLPAGTQCTGGKAGTLCLLSVKSTAGFGGCTVVSQVQNTSASGSTAAGAPATSASAKPCKNKRRAVGTRAPRALRLSAGLHDNPIFA